MILSVSASAFPNASGHPSAAEPANPGAVISTEEAPPRPGGIRGLAVFAVLLILLAIALPRAVRGLRTARQIDQQTDAMVLAERQITETRDAIAELHKQIAADPRNVSLRLQLARALGTHRSYQEALAQLVIAAHLDPRSPDPHLAMADVYEANQVYDRALEEVRRAVALDPGSPDAVARLAYYYVSFDWNRAALNVSVPAVRRHPSNGPLRTVLALVLYQMQEYAAAEREIRKAQQLNPTDRSLYGPLVSVYLHLHRPSDAERAARMALEVDPTDPLYLLTAAHVKLELKQPQAAIQLARAALQRDPRNLAARYQLALAFGQTGNLLEEQKQLEQVIHAQRNFENASVLLAHLYQREGRTAEAAELLRGYAVWQRISGEEVIWSLRVGRQPNDANAHYQLGRSEFLERLYPRAVVELKEAIRLNPGEQQAYPLLRSALEALNRPLDASAIHAPSSGQKLGDQVTPGGSFTRGRVKAAVGGGPR